MKLATYKDGSRDGQLVVVSRDLSLAHYATGTATRMQQVLDDWNFLSPQLQDLYVTLNQGRARHAFAFEPRQCMAPLPRAYQWASGAACVNPAAGAGQASAERERPAPAVPADPTVTQGASDDFLGPNDEAWFGSSHWGIDFEAALAVITGDVLMGANADQALNGVRLLMLANGWALRGLEPDERARGAGLVQSRPAPAFSPVAVTPDELGDAWVRGRVNLSLQTAWNGKKVGLCDTGPGMAFHFGQLIAHLAKTRNVRAGSVVGSGAVRHPGAARGYHCIADQRALETADGGQARTDYMKAGDTVRIEMKGRDGLSVFGAIEQGVGGPQDLPDAATKAAQAAD